MKSQVSSSDNFFIGIFAVFSLNIKKLEVVDEVKN